MHFYAIIPCPGNSSNPFTYITISFTYGHRLFCTCTIQALRGNRTGLKSLVGATSPPEQLETNPNDGCINSPHVTGVSQEGSSYQADHIQLLGLKTDGELDDGSVPTTTRDRLGGWVRAFISQTTSRQCGQVKTWIISVFLIGITNR